MQLLSDSNGTRKILFSTPHGSHLYGLANEDSDNDYYTVVTKMPVDHRWGRQTRSKYAKQKIQDGEDHLVIDLGTWLEQCRSGVPQALEAMFSNEATVDHLYALRSGYRVGTGVYDRYLRTIKSFALSEDDGFKRRRHALRLAHNLADIRRYGRFEPTLTEEGALFCTAWADLSGEEVYQMALEIAWSNDL